MEQVIERLRKSKATEMHLERSLHVPGGYDWASNRATVRQLERVAEIDVEDFATEMAADDDDDRAAIFWTLASAIYQSTDGSYFDELSTLIGTPKAYPTVGQTLGFVEGVQMLWGDVSDKL